MTPVAELLVLLAAPGVPLALAVLLLVRRGSAALHTLAALAAVPALVTGLSMPPGIATTLPWLLEGSEFGLDDVGRVFLLFSAAIWLAAGVYARGEIAPSRRNHFFVFFLLAMSGNLGLIVARDMLAFYLFFTLMSFAAYGLIAHDRSTTSRHAARVYMTLVVAGDMMIYAALMPAALESGGELLLGAVRDAILDSAYRDLIIALLVVGFGIKAGLLGPHFVLPLIYGVAPTPAAAALAGAMLHAGLLGWLRFLPAGAEVAAWGAALVALGLFATFYGVLAGLTQRRGAVLLAYSSISQMGIMTAGVGAAMQAPEHRAAIVAALAVYAMHHAFAKASLFVGLGIAGARVWTGASKHLACAGLLLPALALTGAPLTSGMLAKELLKERLDAAPGIWGAALAGALPWTGLATTLIVARFLWIAWPVAGPAQRNGIASIGWADWAGWTAMLLATAGAVWLLPIEDPPMLWRPAVVWEVLWPVGAGVAVAAAVVWAVAAHRLPRVPATPVGDVGVTLVRLAGGLWASWARVATDALPRARTAVLERSTAAVSWPFWTRAAATLESVLTRWEVATTLFLALILVLVTLTVWL